MTNVPHQTNHTNLRITGMTCDGCKRHVTKVLQKIPGVSEVVVDRQQGTAQVLHQVDTTAAELVHAVEAAGYQGTIAS